MTGGAGRCAAIASDQQRLMQAFAERIGIGAMARRAGARQVCGVYRTQHVARGQYAAMRLLWVLGRRIAAMASLTSHGVAAVWRPGPVPEHFGGRHALEVSEVA